MTRKCVICKETNYKNGSSFFSAPKDPETRKLWQDAIGTENYVVKDDTYVCSKHFHSADIITHWYSGVPPHVITIKYKKFRLRQGAIPKIGIDTNDKDLEYLECEAELQVNRSLSPLSEPLLPSSKTGEFSIPRTDSKEAENKLQDLEDPESQNFSEDDLPTFSPEHKSEIDTTNYNLRDKTKSYGDNKILNRNAEEENEFHREQEDEFHREQEDEFHQKQEAEFLQEQEVDFRQEQEKTIDSDDSTYKSSNLNNETMLFEDLLEIYTEVTLPKGWASFVIPKGHGTTVVYSSTKMNKSGIPVVEKQVFVKNNMILRCSVRNRNLDPMIHNLIKEKRNLKVQTLMDVEELINEFNKRQICDGNPARNLVNIEAFYEGTNWRHAACPLIINNGLSKCSKCASLNSRKRKFTSVENTYSIRRSRFVERQKIKSLEKSINERVKLESNCEDRLSPLSPNTVNLLSEVVDFMKIPKIQKLMIKECFKFQNLGKKNVAQFSRSWIFLCLLLYIESPQMYKFILQNKYMNLPNLSIIGLYLSRIEADREFYKIFQENVQKFQLSKEMIL